MTDYRIDVYDPSGNRQAVLTDFDYLAYSKQVNNAGIIEVGIDGSHIILSSLADKWQFEVWRKPDGGAWGREISGIYRWFQWEYTDNPDVKIICDGILSMLGWRIVSWKAGTTDRSQFTSTAAETIAKTLVKYNATSDASVANGRIREGAISGVSIQTDNGGGNSTDWYCAYANLLETLKDLSKIGGGDFDLVKTSTTTYEFRWYSGQLGSDKTDSIIFALERGNMANPVYLNNRQREKTVAVVGGQGEGSDRLVVVRTGPNYSSNNDVEEFVAATDVDTQSGLEARGDQKLDELKAIQSFGFDVLQTEGCRYGIDYVLGDLVTAIDPYTGSSVTVKVAKIAVGLNQDGKEKISVGVLNV